MEIKKKKNHLFRIRVYFIIYLFTVCLTMNVFFCRFYNVNELLDKITVIETLTILESSAANGDGDNEATSKNACTTSITAVVPKEIILHLFLIVTFFFFVTLFILLPDGWTLINHKIRLDN